MRETCFLCGAVARWKDVATGEGLCWSHHTQAVRRVREGRPLASADAIDREWAMLRAVQAWHAGSAYERDLAMAKRLGGVVR